MEIDNSQSQSQPRGGINSRQDSISDEMYDDFEAERAMLAIHDDDIKPTATPRTQINGRNQPSEWDDQDHSPHQNQLPLLTGETRSLMHRISLEC